MPNALPYVILASASPRRRELLALLGVDFEVRPSTVEEKQIAGESGERYVARLAREKAEDVARAVGSRAAVVLGADTEVILDHRAVGKPQSDAHAAEMLRSLAGRAHDVLTAICVIPLDGGAPREEVVSTRVHFGPMSDEEIAAYVATGEPRDKAGAYGIQGGAAKFIERIEGCYYNVMGLPVAALYRSLSH
jgi:septum formation protein